MKRIQINRKKTLIAACIALPVLAAAVFIPRAAGERKRVRRASI